MLSWDDFRYVKAIADTRSLNGAAAKLNVNHSTMFRRLGQIERQLGSRLFDRGRGGYALTPNGENMVQLAARLGEDIVAFERKITGQDLRPSGDLRITTSDMVLMRFLTDILVGFRKAYPEISIEVVVSNDRLNLSRRDADVAVRAGYTPPETMSGRRVAKIAWAVHGAAKQHKQAFKAERDAARLNWVGFSEHIGLAKVATWFKSHGVPAERIVYKIDTMLGVAEAAAGGAGLAVLPCFIGRSVPGLKRLTKPLPELEAALWIVTHPDLSTSARVRAFVDYCAKEIAKQRNILECRNR